MTTTDITLVNAVTRVAVAQAPAAHLADRQIVKIKAHEMRRGDIDMVSKDKPESNLVIDAITVRDDVVTIAYVGQPGVRKTMANRLVTVAR